MTAAEVAHPLGGAVRSGRGYLCRCPAHEARTPSLSITDGEDGRVLVYCHAGCSARDVIEALRDRGLWPGRDRSEPARIVPSAYLLASETTPRMLRVTSSPAPRRSCARAIRSLARWPSNTSGGRGLDVADLPLCLRFHPRLWHSHARENWPAIVVPLRDIHSNEITGVHRTYLARDGLGKAPIEPPRMVLGKLGGAVIKLTPDEDVAEGLHLAEGIETALACMQRGFRPMWACVTAGGIRDFPVLSGIECLTIAADHDHAGLSAAQICGERWQAAGKEVFIRWPHGLGRDFADGAAA